MPHLKMEKDAKITDFNWETINVKNINNDNSVFHILYSLKILSWIVEVFVSSIYIFFSTEILMLIIEVFFYFYNFCILLHIIPLIVKLLIIIL